MKKQVIKLLGILSLLFVSVALSAQTDRREIRGKVTNEDGEPLSSVSVSLKGGSISAMTDDVGGYTIRIPNVTPSVLVFTYVGMKSQEITLGTNDVVDVVLAADAMSLDEVVAIGYGTARKKDLTGSVATIDGDDLAKRNQMQLSQALQGAAP